VIEYLITGRAVTSDGGQMDAFRSKKGENFYAEKPGASLKGRPPELLKKDELKRWLQCRGAHVSGSKEDLVRRVKEYVEAGLTNRLTDPDDGANL